MDDAIAQSGHEVTESDAASRFLALLIGAAVAVAALAAVAGLAALLYSVGAPGGKRTLAVIVAAGMVVTVVTGAWAGTGRTRPPGSLVAGGFVPVLAIGAVLLVAWPIVAPVADVRSVAIALDWIEAPNMGTGPSEALHWFQEANASDGTEGQDTIGNAAVHVIETLILLVALALASVAAGVLGAALHRRRAGRRGASAVRDQAPASILALVTGAALLAALVWPSLWSTANAVVDFDQSAGPEIGVSLSEVARHPEVMWGKRVTVSAEVQEVAGPQVAVIGNDALMVGDTVLIVSESPLQQQVLLHDVTAASLDAGDVVQVTGKVRRFDPAALEADLGVSLDGEAVERYEGPAVLVVDAIDIDVPVASEAGDKEFGAGSSGYDFGISVDDIIQGTDEYLGITVTVSDEVEEALLTPHAFTLGDRHLLVVSGEPVPEAFVEATAYVTGEVRVFHLAEVEEELGIDLDDEAVRAYEGRSFVLAESVNVME